MASSDTYTENAARVIHQLLFPDGINQAKLTEDKEMAVLYCIGVIADNPHAAARHIVREFSQKSLKTIKNMIPRVLHDALLREFEELLEKILEDNADGESRYVYSKLEAFAGKDQAKTIYAAAKSRRSVSVSRSVRDRRFVDSTVPPHYGPCASA